MSTSPGPLPGTQYYTPDGPTPAVIGTEHSVLVGILLMIVVLVILVEVAGKSQEWGDGMTLLLLGPLLLLGFNNSAKFASWVGNNPINPNKS